MADNTRADILLKRIRNHKWMSLVIVGGVTFLALVSFAKGLQEAGAILGKALSQSGLEAQYDEKTKEALVAVARDVDLFFLTIESSTERVKFTTVKLQYIKIKADLRSILLRNRVRPLNELAEQQSELLLELWSNIQTLLSRPDGTNPTVMRISREQMFQAFGAMLILETAKQQGKTGTDTIK